MVVLAAGPRRMLSVQGKGGQGAGGRGCPQPSPAAPWGVWAQARAE